MSSPTEPAGTPQPAPRPGARRFDVVAYLKLFRFPLVFTAMADSVAGFVLPGSAWWDWKALVSLALASAGLYFFGMAMNDIADREKDKELAPGRVLPSGRLSLKAARWAMILALLASGSCVLAPGYRFLAQRLVLWTCVVGSIVAYNVLLKFPPVMGLVRASNLLLGVAAAVPLGSEDAVPVWVLMIIAFPTFLYVSALTYVSILEDAGPDRTKILLGATFMALGALLAATALVVFIGWNSRPWTGVPTSGVQGFRWAWTYAIGHWHGIIFAATLTAWILRRAWTARDKKGVMLIVRDGVGGIIFLDAALVAGSNGLLPGLAIAALVIPAIISVAIFKRLA